MPYLSFGLIQKESTINTFYYNNLNLYVNQYIYIYIYIYIYGIVFTTEYIYVYNMNIYICI